MSCVSYRKKVDLVFVCAVTFVGSCSEQYDCCVVANTVDTFDLELLLYICE